MDDTAYITRVRDAYRRAQQYADCPTCRGAGFLVIDVPVGHADFSKPVPCPTCHNGKLAEQLRAMSQLTGALRSKTFLNFESRLGAGDAFVAGRDYTHDPHGFLTFWGGYGCGKTHLLAAIVNRLVSENVAAVYYTMPDLLQALRQAVQREQFDAFFDRLCRVHVLAIDEVDRFNQTDWASEQVYRLVDERYRQRHRLGTVFATNTDPNTADGALGYLFSRLRDGRVVHITAGDYRGTREKG